MIWACLLTIAGGYAAQHSRVTLCSDSCKLLLVASIVLLTWPKTRYPGWLLLGFALFMQAGQAVIDARLQKEFASDSLLTQVRVVDFPRRSGRSLVMTVTPLADRRLPPRSRVSWFEPATAPRIGDVWELEVRLQRPRGNSNPGVFDYEAWAFRQRIHATGYVVGGKRNRRLQKGTEPIVDSLRRDFVARSVAAAESPETAAVLAAVGVGARHLLTRRQWDHYARSGTSHLMAISGLHIGLAGSVVFLLACGVISVLRIFDNSYLAAIAVSVAAAAAYAAVSGFGVPAQRASLMLTLASIALLRRRHIDSTAIILVAALSVYVLDPIATMTPGFNLSFAAVGLLLWLARRRQAGTKAQTILGRLTRRFRQLITMQLFLMLGLMPLTVLVFQRIAYLATPINLVAVPLFSIFTVPMVLAGLVLAGFEGPLGTGALRAAAVSVEWLSILIDAAMRLPYTDLPIAAITGRGWLLVCLPALWVLLPKGWPGRSLALLAVPALLLHAPRAPDAGCVDAHVLDVGQGLAVVLQTRTTVLVFDTGASFRGGGSAAERVVIPFLKSRGMRSVDWLLVSHADIDHSGGVSALHRYARVATTLAGEPLQNGPQASIACRRGQRWDADGVRFSVLHPSSSKLRTGNDASCVLLVEAGAYRLLLTGDIETDAEREILQGFKPAAVDIVVVPHHGSLTSSSVPFVDALGPVVAIVSAGYGNRWGFPKPAVVQRWRAAGAAVADTATAGAVSLRMCADDGIRALRRDRHERRRFWRAGPG